MYTTSATYSTGDIAVEVFAVKWFKTKKIAEKKMDAYEHLIYENEKFYLYDPQRDKKVKVRKKNMVFSACYKKGGRGQYPRDYIPLNKNVFARLGDFRNNDYSLNNMSHKAFSLVKLDEFIVNKISDNFIKINNDQLKEWKLNESEPYRREVSEKAIEEMKIPKIRIKNTCTDETLSLREHVVEKLMESLAVSKKSSRVVFELVLSKLKGCSSLNSFIDVLTFAPLDKPSHTFDFHHVDEDGELELNEYTRF